MRKYGFLYLLLGLFLLSWVGQYVAQVAEPGKFHQEVFWAATFENWQSEFLQLLVQALGMYVLADRIFTKSKEDIERLETKIDGLMIRTR